MDKLNQIIKDDTLSLYEIISSEQGFPAAQEDATLRRFIASTPQTRAISNDPSIAGTRYTRRLQEACANIFRHFDFGLEELQTVVVNILRGALNFGLRDALTDAYGWYRHNTSFISAQRAREDSDPESWHITEKGYRKMFFPSEASLVMGDVVATGTSLHYALNEIINAAVTQRCGFRSIVFFTYGGSKAEEIFQQIDSRCRELFPAYDKTYVIYMEGRFLVPDINTKLTIRLTGTDLLRGGALMAPEFVESQYESPAYPLERCVIYDAGSRAFWLPEYVADVIDYWRQTYDLARHGVTYQQLLHERFPELDASRLGEPDLGQVCFEQIEKMDKTFNG